MDSRNLPADTARIIALREPAATAGDEESGPGTIRGFAVNLSSTRPLTRGDYKTLGLASLGGIVMAHFGDLLGRKRVFTLSIFLMAISTLGMGLLPTYGQIGVWAPIALLLLRIAQGAAIGGEVPGAWVFVSEHVPSNRIGYACGTLTAGLTVGILLGSLVATAINALYSPAEITDWAWRLPFLLGGVFGLASVYLRRLLKETPIFRELQARKALAAEMPLKTVVRDHRAAVVVSMLLTWLLSAAIVVVILMTPALLQKLHGVPLETALQANSVATLCLAIGCTLGGLIIDRIGAGRFFAIGCPLLGISVWLFYTQSAANPALLMPLYALAGLLVGVVGGVPYVMVRAFPAVVRFSGLSFSYNVSYAVFRCCWRPTRWRMSITCSPCASWAARSACGC
jgi:MFS family permease